MVNEAGAAVAAPWPERECDVVMKGGITSGVLYPTALYAIGQRYRIRGVGGASAGAIGAALGAAAEYGRPGVASNVCARCPMSSVRASWRHCSSLSRRRVSCFR